MSDPVVEELLEKGARAAWDSDSPVASWEQVPPKLQAGYRAQVGAAFDAVFPGWQEGITRGWGVDDSLNETVLSFSGRESAEFHIGMNGGHGDLVSRWLGPWVPVEEGTDG